MLPWEVTLVKCPGQDAERMGRGDGDIPVDGFVIGSRHDEFEDVGSLLGHVHVTENVVHVRFGGNGANSGRPLDAGGSDGGLGPSHIAPRLDRTRRLCRGTWCARMAHRDNPAWPL